ncbi:UNVERIFIED_CONTAM: hypothetical protein GTU68_028787 [Idotea baltica]|nr:hypothetical protein [Idotea baltica]
MMILLMLKAKKMN